MKNLKVFVCLFVTCLFASIQFLNGQVYGYTQGAQPWVERSEELLSRLRLNQTIVGKEDIAYDDIEGNPFLFKDFVPGTMVLINGEVYPLSLRYDIFKGELQFKGKEGTFAVTNADEISSMTMDTIRLLYLNYLKSQGDLSSESKEWLILNTDGKCKLLVRKNMRLQGAELPKPYQEAKRAKFIPQADTYFLKLQDKPAVRITSKKDILNILADKKAELTGFINSNKLGAKDLNDLGKIVKYYNELP